MGGVGGGWSGNGSLGREGPVVRVGTILNRAHGLQINILFEGILQGLRSSHHAPLWDCSPTPKKMQVGARQEAREGHPEAN